MKISMSTTIIVTLLFCILPYLWFIFLGKTNTKKTAKLFKDAIKKENLSFSVKEQWHSNLIGIDKSGSFLLFLKLNSPAEDFLKIDLSEVQSCQINVKSREFIKEKKRETVLQSLDLELTFLTERDPILLNFYDNNIDFQENFELKRAEKWKVLIEQITSKPHSIISAA